MNTLTLNKVLLNARPLNMRRRVVKDKDFIYKVLDREFTFSKTAGGKSIKSSNARIEAIKGNSVVWNQMIRLSDINVGVRMKAEMVDGKLVLTTLVDAAANILSVFFAKSIANHIYLLSCTCENSEGISNLNYAIGGAYPAFTSKTTIIHKSASSDQIYFYPFGASTNTIPQGATATIDLWDICDLTLMFGAGNEPTTIEEYYARKPIVEDEYAYNEGEVIHMTAEGIKSVGDNAWDGLREMGDISGTTGEEFDSSSVWRAEGYIRILPNAEYCVEYTSRAFLRVRFYDKHKNFIGIVSADNTDIYANETFTAPNNAYFIRFAPNLSVIPYDSELCVRLVHSGWKQDTDAGYQPYWEDRLIFDQRIKDEFPNGMKKWDMVYNKNGKGYIVKGTRVVKMKDLNWRYYTESGLGNTMVRATLEGIKIPTTNEERVQGVIVLRYYPTQDNPNVARLQNKCWLHMNGEIFLKDDSFANAASFVASLTDNDVIIYELSTPEVIEYDEPFNLDYRVADFGTEQAITEQPSAPISAEIGYHILKNNVELTLNS